MKTEIYSYIVGFFLSIMLTGGAYLLVIGEPVQGVVLTAGILFFAFIQLGVQLYFFLHLGREPKFHWNLFFFCITFILILTIVIGGIWIMNNLNYRMTPQQINNYLKTQNGF